MPSGLTTSVYQFQAAMSTRYLLPCSCGLSTPVETAQAGENIHCACGATLDIPTLRGLRNLQPAPLDERSQGPSWNPGKGILFLGVLVILAGLGILAYLKLSVPRVDINRVRREAFTMSPAESWQKWLFLQDLPGPYSQQAGDFIRSQPDRKRWQFAGWASVVLGAGVIYCGYSMLQQPPNQG